MEEKKTPRSLEDISHFFLSGHDSSNQPCGSSRKKGRGDSVQAAALYEDIHQREYPAYQKGFVTMKSTCKTDVSSVPKDQLVEAAGKFLLNLGSYEDATVEENIASPKFGSSDLLLTNKAKTTIVCAKLNNGRNCEAFIVSAIAYYFWFREFMKVGQCCFNGKPRLEMYFFLDDLPAVVSYMLEKLRENVRVHLVQYNILQVEGLKGLAIYFQHVFPDKNVKRTFLEPQTTKEPPLSDSTPLNIPNARWGDEDLLKKHNLS